MPSQVERVKLAEFTVTTHANDDRIRDVARAGTQVAKRSMQSSMKEKGSGPGTVIYSIVGLGGFVEQAQVALKWEEVGDGTTRVKLVTGSFMTSRQTFMFIPLTPKMVPGLASLERFSKYVRSELEGKVTT